MASPVPHPVPRALEQRLAALVPRVRALRVARGASLCLLVSVASTALVLFLDAIFGLPATARGLLIAVWVTSVGVLVWRLVVRPWQAEVSLSEVALELARRLPEFADRLSTIVSPENGTSEAVRAALAEDALRRAKAVDFARALPAYPTMLRACGAILTLLAFLMLTGLVPGSAERLRRVALPWARPGAAAVRVVVTSGEPVVKRGGPVTLTAYAERTDSRPGAMPDRATAVFRDGPNQPEERVTMAADEAGVFHVTRARAERDFEYRVQIGGAVSDWFRVAVLDPVELAPDTRFEVTPPDYAKQPRRTTAQLADFDALEFSRLTAQVEFTRPAAAAHFEWRAGGDEKPETILIELAPDRLSGRAAMLLRASGELKLVLVRESDGKRLRTVLAANVRITPDKIPWFESVSGVSSRPRSVRPGWRVPIEFVVNDDFGLSTATIECSLDEAGARIVPLAVPLSGAGTARATGRFELPVLSLANAAGKLRFRVRVTDNHTSADPKLAPQEVLYPPTGWSELTISGTAPPLDEQNIENQHETTRASLEAIRALVREASDAVTAVRAEVPERGALAVDQAVRLNAARDKAHRAQARLTGLARDAALTPELRPLATVARTLAERELQAIGDRLHRAETTEAGRANALLEAERNLALASTNLTALSARNAELGRARLDRARLGALARDQAALAESVKTAPNEFPERQRELLARLKSLIENSDPLRLAFAGASGEEARQFARGIAELSAAVRDLDAASARTVSDALEALVAEIARAQATLAERAAQVFAATETAARLAGVTPPRPDELRRVTQLAADGKTVEALTELDAQRQVIERVATEFERWAADRGDAKKGAKQLALWQDDLLARFRTATKATEFDKLPAAARTAFRNEQQAIRAATGLLHLPPDDTVKTAHESAAVHCAKADELLGADGRGADTAMRFAVEALTRLAEVTPLAGERRTKTAREFDKLRQEQEVLAGAVEQALRNSEGQAAVSPATAKRLATLAEQQQKLAPASAALDLPGFGARQKRLGAAAKLAAADLRDASPFDIQASQALVRREFERFKLALEGLSPPDQKCEELSRKIDASADALDAHGPKLTAKQLEPAAPVVQDALRQLPTLLPEAPALLNDARNALQAAEAAFRDTSTIDETRRRARAAAEALEKLNARLNGIETDLARVQRLAGYRKLAAARAKELANAKAPFNAPESAEALRQLAREVEELTHTRVGAAGQVAKKRVADLYARLRAKLEPDRLPSDQRALADALDELATKMTDVAELTTRPAPKPGAALLEADAYLPSQALAAQLRELVKQQQGLHDRLAGFSAALADRLRPAAANTFAALEARQRAIGTELLALVPEAEAAGRAACAAADRLHAGSAHDAKAEAERALRLTRALAQSGAGKPWGPRAVELSVRQSARLDDLAKLLDDPRAAVLQQLTRTGELAGRASALADALERAAKSRSPQDATRAPLASAAGPVREAAKKLLAAGQKAADADTIRAAKLRAEVLERLSAAHTRTSEAAPAAPAPNPALGEALRATERAMRAALEVPAAESETAATEAANALRTAAERVTLPK